jgi:hypothetical protein
MNDFDDSVEILKSKLQKAEGEPEPEKPEDDEEGKDEFDDKFMKKMQSYMKKNPGKMKELGYMKKAFDESAEQALSIEDDAEVTVIDGTDAIGKFQTFAGEMLKAVESITDRLGNLEKSFSDQAEISDASANVLIKAYEMIDAIGGQPPLMKAAQFGNFPAIEQPVDSGNGDLLQKAQELGPRAVKEILQKAAIDGNGEALDALTLYESANGNLQRLMPSTQGVIAGVIAKNMVASQPEG